MDISIDLIKFLEGSEITLEGEFVWGSNYTFFVQVGREGERQQAVYKPSKGERPLWDFPAASLARRETAAYLVSEMLGWQLVPPTVYREDGPLGPGSLQLFIEHDPNYHYFNFTPEDRQRLRPTAVFDLLINNADRKGSHILRDAEKHLWLIDHGVCFHAENKLRTVIWDFIGESIPKALCSDVRHFLENLESGSNHGVEQLLNYLSYPELKAMTLRANFILADGVFPSPDPSRRSFPWPEI